MKPLIGSDVWLRRGQIKAHLHHPPYFLSHFCLIAALRDSQSQALNSKLLRLRQIVASVVTQPAKLKFVAESRT